MKKQYEVFFSLSKRVWANDSKEAVLFAEKEISEEVCCEQVNEIMNWKCNCGHINDNNFLCCSECGRENLERIIDNACELSD